MEISKIVKIVVGVIISIFIVSAAVYFFAK